MFATPKQTGRSSLLTRTPIGGGGFSGRRSLQATPRTTPSIATKVTRAEHILEETELHLVKALNYPVPVQIQESLKANHRETTIKLHQSGWGWLISGGKLLLWKYSTQQITAQCHQLRLPGYGWCSDLVTVEQHTGAGELQLSVLACSPQGALYYWVDVLRDTAVTCEGSVHVGEGSAHSIASLPSGLGSVVATNTATLHLVVTPTAKSLQSGLSVRELHLPHGMLSGFGRRMTSLFFGSQPSEVQETRKVAVSEQLSSSYNTASVFLLTNANLQKWHVDSANEQMSYDVALVPLIKEAVQGKWVESATPTTQGLSVWLMDMQLSADFVTILFAIRPEGKPTMEHGLALLQAESDVTPLSMDKLVRLNHSIDCPVGRERMALEFGLHGAPATPTVLLHSKSAILLTNVISPPSSSADVIKFPPPDLILGAGHLSSQLLLFTLHQGVVAVSQTSVLSSGSSAAATPSVTKTSRTVASSSRAPSLLATPTQSMGYTPSSTATKSAHSLVDMEASIETLKNSFSEYLDGNLAAARDVCDHHFPPEAFYSSLDTLGDLAIVQLSEMVLDDPPPTSDPQWNESLDVSSSGAPLILIYRLEQKFQAHSRYVQFLTDVGLLDRLTCVRVRGRAMPTSMLLCEHAEKIQAAITLRKLHNQVVDHAIKIALQGRTSSLTPHPTLTKNDLFYTHLTQLEDIFPALIRHEEDALNKMELPQQKFELITGTGNLLDSMLHDAIFYQQSKATLYQSSAPPTISDTVQPEFLPWTASDSRQGTRNCLMEQLQIMLGFDTKDFPSSQEKKAFWSLYVRLADILCDGYTTQLKGLEKQPNKYTEVKKSYVSHRHKFLAPLLEYDQYHHAIELGEKYEDFHILVQLCELLEDKAKLHEYMTRFAAQGFSDFLFKQYLDEGKLRKLLSFSEDFPRELAVFLKPHNSLSWLHHTATKEYGKAYKALERMADNEVKYASKKKTLLSLSKLALLASSEEEEGEKEEKVRRLNDQLHHIAVQQSLPEEILEACGFDPNSMPPLPPEKIIELYIGEENPASDELQFLLVLQYLDFAFPEREESRSIRAYVWSQAVLKDDWSQMSTDDPLSALQGTFFFRIVDHAFTRRLDMLSLLPDLKSLLASPQLQEKGLSDDPSFRLLMKAGYEQVARVQSRIATYASTGQQVTVEANAMT